LPPVLVLATDITAFHIIGGLLALWAVVLSALGVMRHDFPGKGAGQAIVMAITTVLVVGAIASAILSAKDEPKAGEEAGVATKSGSEGENATNGTPAPGTGANSGQQSGGGTPTTPPTAGGTVTNLSLSADPSGKLAFNKDTLHAPAGEVRITMNNPSPIPHNISIEGPGNVDQQGKTVPKGGASEVQLKLQRGDYTFYCSVPGHRQAGMQGTLSVGKRIP
jgi:plastocyanin